MVQKRAARKVRLRLESENYSIKSMWGKPENKYKKKGRGAQYSLPHSDSADSPIEKMMAEGLAARGIGFSSTMINTR